MHSQPSAQRRLARIRQRGLACFTSGLVALLVLGGCATGLDTVVDYNQSYDFSGVRAISFYEGSGTTAMANPLGLSAMTHDRINTALKRAVEGKGLNFVEEAGDADLLLSWHLATENRTELRTVQRPGAVSAYAVGFRPYNRYSLYQCWSCMTLETETIIRDYVQGTFVVDLIDPGLDKSVWRSVTRTRLRDNPDLRQETFDEGAADILGTFPPSGPGA